MGQKAGIIATIILIALVVVGAYWAAKITLIDDYLHDVGLIRYETVFDAYEQFPPQGVIFLGSSMLMNGVNCTQIEERTGAPCLNAGLSGSVPIRRLIELSSIIEAQPALVVMQVTYSAAADVNALNEDQFKIPIDLINISKADSAYLGEYEAFIEMNAIQRFFYERKFVWQMLTNTLSPENEIQRRLATDFKTPYQYDERDRIDVPWVLNQKTPDFYDKFRVSDQENDNKRAVRRIIERLNENNIPVLIMHFPLHSEFSKRIDQNTKENYEAYMNRLVEDYGLLYINYEQEINDELFIDYDHLDGKGREELTNMIISDVILSGGRN